MSRIENKLVDTHTHLYDSDFDRDREMVLAAAVKAGLKAVISVSEDLEDAEKNLALARKHPLIRPAAGLYPTILDIDQAAGMEAFIRKHRRSLVGIGEVGLDYWKIQEAAGRQLQREIFERFIRLALALDLPLNVHSRSAGRHAVDLLLASGADRVQLHAFDGKASAALPAVEAGYYFSIPPSVVRSRQKQKLVRRLPLSRLLVETDSPVLGPDPDQRNVPANVVVVINAISEIKNQPKEAIIDQIAENTHLLYRDLRM